MAEALLIDRLRALGSATTVRSGGMFGEGEPPRPEVITAMAAHGLDVASHRSRRVSAPDLERADLTLAMARENLRYAVVEAPGTWSRAFTIRELVRRGEAIGCRPPGESLADWLARAHDGRRRVALLGDCADDDVADPTGGSQHGYTETAAILSGLLDRLVDLCWASGDPSGRRRDRIAPGAPDRDPRGTSRPFA